MAAATRVLVRDRFDIPRPPGAVSGTSADTSPEPSPRHVTDVERVLSIDHGALRIEPLVRPGWGRCGIAYGPFNRRPGLAMALLIDNGHNLSQSYRLKNWGRQVIRWFRGSDFDSPPVRFWRWVHHRPRMKLARKIERWRASRDGLPHDEVRENLAVGFFPSQSPTCPLSSGNGLIIHANRDFDNGELWARVGKHCVSTCTSLQNLTICYIVVLRDKGAVYYAAALPGAHGVGPYPQMQPIAVDPDNTDRELFAGVHQAVLGEIGFTMDTRVHGVAVAELPDDFAAGHADLPANGVDSAIIDPGAPSSLICARLTPGTGTAGLIFRSRGDSRWEFTIDRDGCTLRVCEAGAWLTMESGKPGIPDGQSAWVQIVDHGAEFTISVDNEMAFGTRIVDPRLNDATEVGIIATGNAAATDFEAHPREVPIPAALDLGAPWCEQGQTVRIRDDFTGPQSDLEGRITPTGNKVWERTLGRGLIEVVGNGRARVAGDLGGPCPERTIYTLPWDDPAFADLDLEMTPPGTRRGETHRGRSGVVFWQDRLNYFMVNLWLHDNLQTASISTFFCIRGFDDLYDAIWTCIGQKRVTWGIPFRMRTVFDGNHFIVWVNNEPVVQRCLTDVYPKEPPMKINRVGLLANWEWGTDTGTVFRDFIARRR